MSQMGRPAQAGETRRASNQEDSPIRRSERLITEKIREFRASLHGAGMTDAVKKMDAISTEFMQYTRLQKETTTNTPTERLEKACTKLEETVEKLNGGAGPTQGTSWASIAARAGPGNVSSRAGPSQGATKAPEYNPIKAKSITVKIKDPKDSEALAHRPHSAIIEQIKRGNKCQAVDIVAMRRLGSGDICIQTATERAREQLEKYTEWAMDVAPSAQVTRKTYAVFVHGVEVKNIDHTNQAAAKKSLQAQNERLHPGLEVINVAWPRKNVEELPKFSSVIVEVASAEQADRILNEGLLEGLEIKKCERFAKELRSTQCFNCYGFGHLARACRSTAKCGRCGEGHQSHACKSTEEHLKCGNCGGPHTAWSKTCRKVQEARKASRTAIKRMSRWYPVNSERTTYTAPVYSKGISPTNIMAPPKRKSSAVATATPGDSKRRAGRPLGSRNSSTASTQRSQPIDEFLSASSTPSESTTLIPSSQDSSRIPSPTPHSPCR